MNFIKSDIQTVSWFIESQDRTFGYWFIAIILAYLVIGFAVEYRRQRSK